MRDAYISALYDLAAENRAILALVADNGAIVYDKYRKDFPGRFINFGIAEANMVSVAAGLASCGKIPFCYTISNFLVMRAYEQIRNDVCMQKMNVKLVGIGAGFIYSNLGPTHHGIEDVSLMMTLPDMTILQPADPLETKNVTIAAAKIEGPVYIRIPGSRTPAIYTQDYDFKVGKGVVLQEGSDVCVISSGNIIHEVLTAVKEARSNGTNARLINLHTLKPIDKEIIIAGAKETGAVLTVEEHTLNGGLGSIIGTLLAESGLTVKFKRLGLDKFPTGYGSYEEMKEMNGLSCIDIARQIINLSSAAKKERILG